MANEADARGAAGRWLPLWGWCDEHRRHADHGREMHDGLRAAGFEVRCEAGAPSSLPVQILSVHVPSQFFEEGERWLLRELERWRTDEHEHWAGSVQFHVDARQPSWCIAGGRRSCNVIQARIDALPRDAAARAPTFLLAGEVPTLWSFARSVTAMLRLVDDTAQQGPPAVGDDHEWVPIDQSWHADDGEELLEFERCLGESGFTTCRYEASGYRLLTVHAGGEWLDQLERRLSLAAKRDAPVWRRRFRPWSHTPTHSIVVHHHPGPVDVGWRLREQLEQRIGAPVDAAQLHGEVMLEVPAAFVARALHELPGL